MASLFTSQTPSGTNGADGGAAGITTATGIVFAVDGSVSGIRFFSTTTVTAGNTYTAELWQATSPTAGTRLGSATASGSAITPGTWNVINFASPISVSDATPYYAAINNNNNQGRYVATGSFFTSQLVNGDITAWQDGADLWGLGAMRNGNFRDNSAANNFPSLTSGSACYFVDVVFTAGGATDVSGVLAAPLGALSSTMTGVRSVAATMAGGLGALTAAITGVREVAGVAAASLGGLTAALTGTREVGGVALAPLGGLTAAMAGTRTVPGVLAANLGTLTASMLTVRSVGAGAPIVSETATTQVVSQTTARTFSSETREVRL